LNFEFGFPRILVSPKAKIGINPILFTELTSLFHVSFSLLVC